MLNISKQKVSRDQLETDAKWSALNILNDQAYNRIVVRFLVIIFVILFLGLLLPWTQNIRAKGFVTSLSPTERHQSINSFIDGRIEKWFVKEGDLVQEGDTIVFLSEIKNDYLDPKLIARTEQQLKAKENSVESYSSKVRALDNQIDALIKTKRLKMEQARNYIKQAQFKVSSDSAAVIATENEYTIAERQYNRTQELYDQGLKSLTDLENKRVKFREMSAKLTEVKNKLLESQNKLINAEVELVSIDNQYRDKLAKAESLKYETMSAMFEAEGEVTKIQNRVMNYSLRSGMYYILAPQTGYIRRANKTGLRETVKEGEELVEITPSDYSLALEMYVNPVDYPLMKKGQHVRIQFDGWPAIIFSGWPSTSFGTFGGTVEAVDQFVSDNGQFRVLIRPDDSDKIWPDQLRMGAGAKVIALLQDVPLWYEIWRQINGFPPDYYTLNPEMESNKSDTKKKDK